jgi:hypothetical protein
LEVWEPNPLGPIIGVADVVAPHGAFATYLTYPGHPDPPFQGVFLINLFEGDVKENFIKKSLVAYTV